MEHESLDVVNYERTLQELEIWIVWNQLTGNETDFSGFKISKSEEIENREK